MTAEIQEVALESPEPRFYASLPNLVDDLPLSPLAYRLYARYKRRAGMKPEGYCVETMQNLAKTLHASKSTILRERDELERWGLIRVSKEPSKHGEFERCRVTVVNIWTANIVLYTSAEQGGLGLEQRKALLAELASFMADSSKTINLNAYFRAHCPAVQPSAEKRRKKDLPAEKRPASPEPITPRAALTAAEKIQAYPKDCRETLNWLVDKYGWSAANIPDRPVRGAPGGDFAWWIKEVRQINEQLAGTGERGLAAAARASKDLTISHPGGITWALAGEVGKIHKEIEREEEERRRPLQLTGLDLHLLEKAWRTPESEWMDMQRRVVERFEYKRPRLTEPEEAVLREAMRLPREERTEEQRRVLAKVVVLD